MFPRFFLFIFIAFFLYRSLRRLFVDTQSAARGVWLIFEICTSIDLPIIEID